MKLIVGLGNPGDKYEHTRHNVGFNLVETLNTKYQILNTKFEKKFNAEMSKTSDLILAKPQTYMNDSGRAVRAIADYYDIESENICVAHDDLDIEMGKFKLEFARGPKIHNGVNSVEDHLGTKDFWRVRIGVDNRTKEQRSQIKGREYVLMKMGNEEKEVLNKLNLQMVKKLSETFGIEYRV